MMLTVIMMVCTVLIMHMVVVIVNASCIGGVTVLRKS